MEQTVCSKTSTYKIQMPANTPKRAYNIQNMAKVWNQEYFTSMGRKLQDTFDYLNHSSYLPAYEDRTDSVPKRWHIKFRCRGITQKKAYNIEVLYVKVTKLNGNVKWIWIISLKNNYFSTKSQITLRHLSYLDTAIYSLLTRLQLLLYQHFSSVPSAGLYCTAKLAMKTLNAVMMACDTTEAVYFLDNVHNCWDICFPIYLQLMVEWYKYPWQLSII